MSYHLFAKKGIVGALPFCSNQDVDVRAVTMVAREVAQHFSPQAAPRVNTGEAIEARDAVALVSAAALEALSASEPAPGACTIAEIAGPELAANVTLPARVDPFCHIELTRVNAILEGRIPAEQAPRVHALERAAISAASKGYAARALEKAVEVALLAPGRAEALVREPAFASLRKDLETALHRLVAPSKVRAQARLDEAENILRHAPPLDLTPEGRVDPESVLALARQSFEKGGHVQLALAANLAQLVIDHHRALRPNRTRRAQMKRCRTMLPRDRRESSPLAQVCERMRARVETVWRRGPLLLLLLGWLAAGIAGAGLYRLTRGAASASQGWLVGFGFDVWALGFLGLVGFGYYMRVRDIRFPDSTE